MHSHWLMDVFFGMLNIVLMSPLSHGHNNDYCIMIGTGDLLPHVPRAGCFRNNKKIFNSFLYL